MSAPIASRHRGSCPGTCFQTAVSFSLVHMYGCAEDSADQSAIACDRRCARLRSSRSLTRGLRNCGGRPRHPRQGGCLQDAARAADLERSAFAQGAAFGGGFLDPKGRCARSRLPPSRRQPPWRGSRERPPEAATCGPCHAAAARRPKGTLPADAPETSDSKAPSFTRHEFSGLPGYSCTSQEGAETGMPGRIGPEGLAVFLS